MKALITMVLLTAGAVWAISTVEQNDVTGLVLGVPLMAIDLWLMACMLASTSIHMDDLAKLHASDTIIETAEAKLKGLRDLSSDAHGLPESLLALSQDHSPASKYMELIQRALKDVEQSKDDKARIVGRIASRKAGPFNIVVSLFGDSIPA